MDELIDILDEKGNFVRKEMKSVAHKEGLWHRSIHAYLINSKNEILLQQRSFDKNLYPGYWDVSFAGHVGAGEDTRISAKRECLEELGLELADNEMEYLFTLKERLKWGKVDSCEFVYVYLCEKDFDIKQIKLQEEEVASFTVMPMEEFIEKIKDKNQKFIPHDDEYRRVIEYLNEREVVNE